MKHKIMLASITRRNDFGKQTFFTFFLRFRGFPPVESLFSTQAWHLFYMSFLIHQRSFSLTHTYIQTHLFFPFMSLLLLFPFPPILQSLARHTASPTVGNVNGLSLLGVAAPSLALQANLRQPLRWEQHTQSLQQSVGAKNRTMWKEDDEFRLGLGIVSHAACRAQQSREQAARPKKSFLDNALF